MLGGLGQLKPRADGVPVQSPHKLRPPLRYQRSLGGLGRSSDGNIKHPLDRLDVTFNCCIYSDIHHLAAFKVFSIL